MKKCLLGLMVVTCISNLYAMETEQQEQEKPETLASVAQKYDQLVRYASFSDKAQRLRQEKLAQLLERYVILTGNQQVRWHVPASEMNIVSGKCIPKSPLKQIRPLGVNALRVVKDGILVPIFKTMPLGFQPETLEAIDIRGNGLQELPLTDIVKACPHLKMLNAGNNQISYVSMFEWPNVPVAQKLEHLNLDNNNLAEFSLGKWLESFPHLQSIDVSSNPIKTFEWKGRNNPSLNAVFPLIFLCNTSVSAEKKEAFIKEYMDAIKTDEYTSATLGAVGGGLLIWKALAVMALPSPATLAFGISYATYALGGVLWAEIIEEKEELLRKCIFLELSKNNGGSLVREGGKQ